MTARGIYTRPSYVYRSTSKGGPLSHLLQGPDQPTEPTFRLWGVQPSNLPSNIYLRLVRRENIPALTAPDWSKPSNPEQSGFDGRQHDSSSSGTYLPRCQLMLNQCRHLQHVLVPAQRAHNATKGSGSRLEEGLFAAPADGSGYLLQR
eukprot:2441997-Pyramimonas_sp.AAC.1